MQGIGRRIVVAALAAPLAGALFFGAPASAAAPATYGPSWGRFIATFPSSPRASGNLTSQLKSVPGATAAYGYAVSQNKNLFKAAQTTASIPTYEVVVVRFSSAHMAAAAVAGIKKQISQPTTVSRNGALGFEAVRPIPASAASNGQPATQAYTLGLLLMAKGKVGYQVVAATPTRGPAESFLVSVSPS